MKKYMKLKGLLKKLNLQSRHLPLKWILKLQLNLTLRQNLGRRIRKLSLSLKLPQKKKMKYKFLKENLILSTMYMYT
jgi:hypothetical protein